MPEVVYYHGVDQRGNDFADKYQKQLVNTIVNAILTFEPSTFNRKIKFIEVGQLYTMG